MPRDLGSTLAVVIIRVLSIVAGLAYVKSYTRVLSTDEVGRFFYLATLSYALNALIFVPVDFYMQARISRLSILPIFGLRRLVIQVLLIGMMACIGLTAPLIMLGKLQVMDIPALYAVASLLYVCSTIRGVINNRRGSVFVSSMLLFEAMARLGSFVLATVAFGGSARTLMISSALALALEFVLLLRYSLKHLPQSYAPGELDTPATIFRAAAPIAASAVCNTIQLQTYRLAYPLMGFSAISGIYGVVANIGGAAMSASASIFSQIYIPQLYSSQGASIGRYLQLAFCLSIIVMLPALVFSEGLVRLLTKNEYVPYSSAIAFGVIAEAGNLIIGGITVLLAIQRRTHILLKFNMIAAFSSVIGCFAMLNLRPHDPFAIGISVASSQFLLVTALVIWLIFEKKDSP